MGRSSWLAVGLGLVLAPAATAAETYTLKIKELARGDVVRIDTDDQFDSATKITDPDGKTVLDKKDRTERVSVFRETILEREAGKRRPSRLQRHYDKAQVVTNGKTTELPYQGKTVLIEKKGREYHFRIEGGEELTPKEAGPLNDEFNKDPDEEFDLQAAILPKKAVALNETWSLDLKPLLASYSRAANMEFDADKAEGTGKLVKVYDRDGARFGVLQLHLGMPIKAFLMGEQKQAVEPGAKWTLDLTLDGCIDGTRIDGTRKTTHDIRAASQVPIPEGKMGKVTMSAKGTSKEEGKEEKK
jgi:hypothetical protein